jgi:hypothetical protein
VIGGETKQVDFGSGFRKSSGSVMVRAMRPKVAPALLHSGLGLGVRGVMFALYMLIANCVSQTSAGLRG